MNNILNISATDDKYIKQGLIAIYERQTGSSVPPSFYKDMDSTLSDVNSVTKDDETTHFNISNSDEETTRQPSETDVKDVLNQSKNDWVNSEEESAPLTDDEIDNKLGKRICDETFKSMASDIGMQSKPATKQETILATSSMANKNMQATEETDYFKEACKTIGRKHQQKQEKPSVFYQKDSFSLNGKSYNFKRMIMKPDWADEISAKFGENRFKNLNTLKEYITNSAISYFGSASRISSIAVFDYQLIINNVCYCPIIKPEDANKLPFDVMDYIRNGSIAMLFDWDILRYMSSLRELAFDDMTFVTTTVADDIGVGRNFGTTSLFKICKSLDVLTIGSETVKRADLYDIKSKGMRDEVKKAKRFNGLFDGFHLNVYSGTSGFQNFTVNNLKNYATNRGDKGLFRYLFGTTFRAGLAATGVVMNAGAHLVGGITKLFKDAVKPLSDDELPQSN